MLASGTSFVPFPSQVNPRSTNTTRLIDQGYSCRRRTRRSDPEDLLLLGLELLVAEDALIPKLGEPLQLTHVLGFGCCSRGRSRRSSLGRLLAATEVLPHPCLALDVRAASLHA